MVYAPDCTGGLLQYLYENLISSAIF